PTTRRSMPAPSPMTESASNREVSDRVRETRGFPISTPRATPHTRAAEEESRPRSEAPRPAASRMPGSTGTPDGAAFAPCLDSAAPLVVSPLLIGSGELHAVSPRRTTALWGRPISLMQSPGSQPRMSLTRGRAPPATGWSGGRATTYLYPVRDEA